MEQKRIWNWFKHLNCIVVANARALDARSGWYTFSSFYIRRTQTKHSLFSNTDLGLRRTWWSWTKYLTRSGLSRKCVRSICSWDFHLRAMAYPHTWRVPKWKITFDLCLYCFRKPKLSSHMHGAYSIKRPNMPHLLFQIRNQRFRNVFMREIFWIRKKRNEYAAENPNWMGICVNVRWLMN